MEKVLSCAITGHRPSRFKWKYNEDDAGCKRLKTSMRSQFVSLYEKGTRRFYIGGALGTDMWAGEILLQLKEQPEYKDLELVAALPFKGHDAGWDDRSRRRLCNLLDQCAEIVVVGSGREVPAVKAALTRSNLAVMAYNAYTAASADVKPEWGANPAFDLWTAFEYTD